MIAPGGSLQSNESFNHMSVTRAPKSRFYGSTKALSYRVDAAVLQKNVGATHIVQVNKRALLSPGGLTKKYRQREALKQQRRALRQKTLEYKRRRLFLKDSEKGDIQKQKSSGVAYMSAMGTTMQRAVEASCATNSWVPERVECGTSCTIVIVDLETTGFGKQASIVQIAARDTNNNSFSAYMIPQKRIEPQASIVTGLQICGDRLLLHGQEVATKESIQAATDFLDFLQNFQSTVLLVGHNVVIFDFPILIRWLQSLNLDKRLGSFLVGFADTLPLLKKVSGEKCNRLEALAEKKLTSDEWSRLREQAHDATIDCLILEGLLNCYSIGTAELMQAAIPTPCFYERQAADVREKLHLSALAALKGVVSAVILKKMARQGVTIQELRTSLAEHGAKGIEACLGVSINGKPRVTACTRIIEAVVQAMQQIQDT